jgi:putative DNA primase/helicase
MSDIPPGLPPEPKTTERMELEEKLKQGMLGKLEKKTYPNYAQFCDDPEEETGFKPARVAEWIAEHEHFKTDEETEILFYGDEAKGVWSRDGEVKLKQITTEILGENDRKSHYENILHTVKNLTYQKIVFSEKLACENGLLNVETMELTPFTLEEMAFHQIEATYNPEAETEHFTEFMKQVLNPEDIATLQEWSGYLLLPDYRFHKLLWIHGVGRNGKGVWQRTMEDILGESNVSSLGLEELDGNHRFALERLYGKLFNPCSEPTTNRVLQTALLKKATGQDTIEAEIKGKQKRVKFRNCAKITVIANKFPKVKDTTTAFSERRLFITFPNEFTGKECIVNIERVWLEDPIERMGILNWMLEGLHRLLVNGCFTESKSQEETELLFERASDSIGAFLKEMVVYDKNLVTTRSDAFTSYKDYCDFYGLDADNEKKFTQRLKETPRVSVTTVSHPKRERAWRGIGLKNLKDDTDVTDVTGKGGLYPLAYFKESNNREESSTPVTSVTGVTENPKNCGHCVKFRMPNCDSEAWESRNGNDEPLTNWCFKPIQEIES